MPQSWSLPHGGQGRVTLGGQAVLHMVQHHLPDAALLEQRQSLADGLFSITALIRQVAYADYLERMQVDLQMMCFALLICALTC